MVAKALVTFSTPKIKKKASQRQLMDRIPSES